MRLARLWMICVVAMLSTPALAAPEEGCGEGCGCGGCGDAAKVEEEEAEEPGGLETAIQDLAKTAFSMRVNVSRPEAEAAQDGNARIQILINGMRAGGGAAFKGDMEVHRDKEGTLVMVSQKELPGFAIYKSVARTVVQQSYEDNRTVVRDVRQELGSILDLQRLAKFLKNAETKSTMHEDGGITYEAKISRRLIKHVPNPNGQRMPAFFGQSARVLRILSKLTLDPEGKLVSASFDVVHQDPLAQLKGRIMVAGGGGGGGGGGMPVPVPQDEDQKGEETGPITRYTVTFGGRPSARLRTFKARTEKLLSGKGADDD